MANRVASTFQAAASGSQAMGTVATGFRLMSQSPGFGVAGGESGTAFMVPLQAEAPDPTPMGPSVTESGPSQSMKASSAANSGEDVALTWDVSGHLTMHLALSESIGVTTGQWRQSMPYHMYSVVLVLHSHSHLSHVVNNKLPSSWVIHTWSLKFSNSKWAFEFIGHPKDDIANFCLHESPHDKPHWLYWMPQYPNLKHYPHFYSATIPSTPLTFTNMAKYRPYIHHTPEDPSFPSQTNVICIPGKEHNYAHSWFIKLGQKFHIEMGYQSCLHTFVHSQWMIYTHWNSIREHLSVPPPPGSASLELV